jgi:hypothetical protein
VVGDDSSSSENCFGSVEFADVLERVGEGELVICCDIHRVAKSLCRGKVLKAMCDRENSEKFKKLSKVAKSSLYLM